MLSGRADRKESGYHSGSASWGIQKMQQYFPMNVNFMLNLSPNEKGKLDKNLEEEFARVGSLLSFPEPLTELPEDWLTRK